MKGALRRVWERKGKGRLRCWEEMGGEATVTRFVCAVLCCASLSARRASPPSASPWSEPPGPTCKPPGEH